MKKLNLLLLMSLIFGALIFNSCDDDPEEVIQEAPTVTAPSSNIAVAAGASVDVSFTVTVPGGYASAEVSAQGGSATISDEPAEGATSGTLVVSFTAGSTAGAASVTLTVTDQNEKSGNATANLSINEVIPEAPTVSAPSSITVAAGDSVDVSFTVTVPGGYASAEVSAQGGSATISDEPAEGETSGTVVVSFTAGSTAGAASVTLTVTDKNEKSGNAIADLSIEEEEAPTVTAPSTNIAVAAGASVDVSFTVNVPGGYASAEVSAQGGSATISEEPTEGETSGTVVVSFTAGTTGGAASVTLTVTDQNQKSGNATANLSINEPITDIDGNVYTTVVIGDQEWFAEDLKTTKYNDGTAIPRVNTNADWSALTTGAYTIYPDSLIDGLNSDEEILEAYGALYNWYAVETGKLCPEGWHVATDEEWTVLINYAGGLGDASGKLKSKRTEPDAHPRWKSPNTGATDEYGFSALPGGRRSSGGGYFNMGDFARWWTSTAYDETNAIDRNMYFDAVYVGKTNYSKRGGFSVRCIRD